MLPDISRGEVYRIDGLWLGAYQAMRYLRNLGFSWPESRAYLAALDRDRREYFSSRSEVK